MVQVLQNKFDDFKHRIEAGSERFGQCEELAKKLIANESPYSADIERRQEQLRWAAHINTSVITVNKFIP